MRTTSFDRQPCLPSRAPRPAAWPAAVLLAFACAAPALAAAQEPKPAAATLVIPKLSHAPKIDGVLDNPIWTTEALKIEDFVQLSPKENGVPGEKTVAYLGYDEKNLYIAFRCFDRKASTVRCSVTGRDNILQDDWIVVFLDTFNEKRRAFSFFLNPIGVQMDMIRVEEGGSDNMDGSWDTVFTSDGKLDPEGWTVEAAIPFKSLRFPNEEKKVWNLVLGRNLPRTGEVILWPTFSRKIPGLLSQGRGFVLPTPVERGRNLEVMPVLTSLQREGDRLDVQPGVNLKYGVSSNMTADLTVNPDFSHIEADAPQIDYNLRYALRYPEKRPFFLEGMEIFKSPDIETVYTRRIMDPLAGAKLSGKAGRFAYGILSSYDMHPSDSLWNIHGGSGMGGERALFNVARVKADVGKGSYIGFALTDKEMTGGLWNRVGGLDGQLRFKDHVFVSFQALASQTELSDRRTPVAPAFYGEAYYTSKHWFGGVSFRALHPDFDASAGFVNRVDYRSGNVFTGVNLYPDKSWMNRVDLQLSAGRRDGYFNPTTQDTWVEAELRLRMTEFNQVNIEYDDQMERFAGIDFRRRQLNIQGDTSFISWMPFGFFFQTGESVNYDESDPFLGYSNQYGIMATVKPSARLQLGLDVSKETFWRHGWGGDRLWDYNVVRQKTTYQLSKTLALRTIVDYNLFYKQVFGSFLVSWVYRPGTVAFIGFDSNYLRDTFGHYLRDNYSLFIKFSYWWRD